jgi:hypothetical protein
MPLLAIARAYRKLATILGQPASDVHSDVRLCDRQESAEKAEPLAARRNLSAMPAPAPRLRPAFTLAMVCLTAAAAVATWSELASLQL